MTGPARSRRFAAPRVRTTSGAALGVRRIRWTLALFAVIVLATVGKLVEIQVLNADAYAESGIRQRARTVDLPATRGRVYDRDGDVLATSVQSAAIYADPRAFRPTETPDGTEVPAAADPARVAAELAPVLDADPAKLEQHLDDESHFVYLGRQLDHEVGERVRELELPGIGVIAEPERVYPAGELAAQIVGFTGIDGEGLQGLEARYDPVLAGSPGMLVFERAPGGLDIASGVRELVPPEAGTDLVLSIDREIQYVAEQAAASALEEFDAAGATVVVQEVATGEMLAMASAPGFDPNLRDGDEGNAKWRNRAVTDVFEPGSTQKALTVAAALEEQTVESTSTLEVPDNLEVSGKRFTDAVRHDTETWTVAEIMERSSNVGTIKMAQELGDARLEEYLRDFGYGRPSGLGFPGEADGLLMPHESWWGTSLPTIAIGHGVGVTLAQLTTSYATLANDGRVVTPSLVRGTVGEDGRLTPANAPDERQVVSPETAREIQAMLERAVSGEDGTGALAQVEGYRVAGKTGTARKPAEGERGYSNEYVATFTGFAPADDPRLVVGVMVDEPTPYFGGLVAAPVFSEVMEAALRARRIPADTSGQDLTVAMDTARQRVVEELATAAVLAELGLEHEAPGSLPVGSPAGGDGASVIDVDEADDADEVDGADEADGAEDPAGGPAEAGTGSEATDAEASGQAADEQGADDP
jgi:cell division protein FtsI (penicillin-binding protein 3)